MTLKISSIYWVQYVSLLNRLSLLCYKHRMFQIILLFARSLLRRKLIEPSKWLTKRLVKRTKIRLSREGGGGMRAKKSASSSLRLLTSSPPIFVLSFCPRPQSCLRRRLIGTLSCVVYYPQGVGMGPHLTYCACPLSCVFFLEAWRYLPSVEVNNGNTPQRDSYTPIPRTLVR